jgi:ubiquinone/menaquinone biosynthesis C-methylase UbiE
MAGDLNAATRLKGQFSIRSKEFDISANWISDRNLIGAHVGLAGKPCGQALELCCGTGQVGRALKEAGWDVAGLDICDDMVKISSRYFPVSSGKAEKLPFEAGRFNLVVCRQAFQFLDVKAVLAGVARVLAPGGVFVVSLTVPFSEEDKDWLYEIHRIKQPLLLKFYTKKSLIDEIKQAGFEITGMRDLKVRESINRWMEYAPELASETKEKVIAAVENAPETYKKLHNVEVKGKEVFEDWNWVVLKTTFSG